jgi:hypothetical protein
MAKIIRDVTEEFNMSIDTSAAIFKIEGGFAVAWGRGYEAMADDRRWDAHGNTPENGARFFPTLAGAEAEVEAVMEALDTSV